MKFKVRAYSQFSVACEDVTVEADKVYVENGHLFAVKRDAIVAVFAPGRFDYVEKVAE